MGESRREITKTIPLSKPVINHENKMVDAIDGIEWEETRKELREIKTLVIHIHGGNRERESKHAKFKLWQVAISYGKQRNQQP